MLKIYTSEREGDWHTSKLDDSGETKFLIEPLAARRLSSLVGSFSRREPALDKEGKPILDKEGNEQSYMVFDELEALIAVTLFTLKDLKGVVIYKDEKAKKGTTLKLKFEDMKLGSEMIPALSKDSADKLPQTLWNEILGTVRRAYSLTPKEREALNFGSGSSGKD